MNCVSVACGMGGKIASVTSFSSIDMGFDEALGAATMGLWVAAVVCRTRRSVVDLLARD